MMTETHYFLKKLTFFLTFILFSAVLSAADLPEDSVTAKMDELKKTAQAASSAEQKVTAYSQLASLQEQLGFYTDAKNSWSLAANYSAAVNVAQGNASSAAEAPLLGAVRCALSTGDTGSADYIMSTAFLQQVSPETQAYVKLYAVWSWLCKVETQEELAQPVAVLQNALQQNSMQTVKPVVLLTLWYLTGNQAYADQIHDNFPSSPEDAVANGGAVIMPAPFWYFVPAVRPEQAASREATAAYTNNAASSATSSGSTGTSGSSSPSAGTAASDGTGSSTASGSITATSGSTASSDSTSASSGTTASSSGTTFGTADTASSAAKTDSAASSDSSKATYQQLGFFRDKSNAQSLVDRVAKSGFKAEIKEEKRESGTVYYAVVVPENPDGTVGQQLKNAGYECYPVYPD